jgi:outer membrane protein
MKQTIPTYRLSLLLLLALMTGRMSFAQSQSGPLTLQQCIQYGLSNNTGVLKSKLEIERSEEKKGETRSGYLPQVNGTVSALDNLRLQTMILPGEFIGQPGTKVPVQFGTKYNITAGLDATQVLYNQQLIGSMKITEQSTKISEINSRKTEEQLMYDIASAYYAAQVALTQKTIVESNLAQVDTLLKLTNIQFENGFAKQLDLDRLTVSQMNLRTDLANSETTYQQQLLLLKFYMGMPLETTIELPVINDKEQGNMLINMETLNRTDLDLIQAQKGLYELNLQQIRHGYIPTLSFTFHSAVQLQQNNLRIFGKDANWYPLSYVGLNLNVPIFDGLQKNYQVKQTKLQIQQSDLDEQNLTESLKMQRTNANNALTTNRLAMESQQRNVELARKVYETTQAQYVGGIATMTDIVNAETSMREAQTNYLRALVQVKLAELDLIKTTGNISSLN